jgi:amino-acid N-acetyltransferase
LKVEKATLKEVSQIQKLVNSYARKGFLLPRSLPDIYESIREFFVVKDGSEVAAAGALKIFWEDLAEIRSLAVDEKYRGQGLGRELVDACFREAMELGVKKVFVLTNTPEYFSRLGFYSVDRKDLPQKVWSDCLKCPKFPDCDEVPLMIDLDALSLDV